ncbi:hypothetical protein V495_02230 [Pseudogymnoascus sp. VKM F-4514 (FW-929)]|nr:hypothetical protein V495_02230 [Pseudogymnoascus sp. VKM F-4514 (FW-929)]KFY67259.1 hypothetical protein V497_00496 [Pseudogymnoascus sp. VKM F-4516 (FW-969)]
MGKKANKKPTVLLSKVPSLRDICDALGFRNSKEQNAFTDFTHKWRKTYRTSDNRSGTDLIQWKLPKTQDDLTRMANTFLHGVGTGEKFWPQLETPGDRLCFPDDEEKITELLKQLFWKQNKYAFNNAKYPKNNESRDPFRYSVDRQSSRDTSEIPARSTSIRGSANRPATDLMIVAKVEDRDRREEEERTTSESAPEKPQSRSKYAATCETEVEEDIYTIQDDDPPATPRASRRKNHHYDEPYVAQKFSASKQSSDTTPRNISSKRPSQSTLSSSPKDSMRGYNRALKRPKVSDGRSLENTNGRSPESINTDFGSPRRVSDRKPVPRVISETIPSADINEYITDDQPVVIESTVPTSQSSNISSKSRIQVVPENQLPASPPTISNTTEVERDQAQSKKNGPISLQQPPTTSKSLYTPPVASEYIPLSPSLSLRPPSPAAIKEPNPPKPQLQPSPSPTEQLPLTQRSSIPKKPQLTTTVPTAPTSKAPLPIPFYILQHTDGITRQTFWEAGRFGTKSLDEFLVDLAEKLLCRPGDITMVKLVLRLGPLEINHDIEAGREDVWEMMKGTFKEEIRRAKGRGIGMGAVNVLVQPVMMERGGSQWGGDGEEDEFEL